MTTSPAAESEVAAPPQRRHWVWLIAGLVGLFVFALGSRGLNEPDEGRYANIARAMVVSGDWWEPRMSGFAHYDKPPLIYWATASAFKIFGLNEWAARLPSLFGAFCALAGLGWAAWRLYGPRVSWWAILICGTSAQFFILARILTPDMLLTGWCSLAIGAWAETRKRSAAEIRDANLPESTTAPLQSAPRISRSSFAWHWWSLSVAFWTLAWWTKATPALVPLVGLVAGVLLTRDRAGWRALRLPLLLPLVLVFGSIWYLSMLRRYPELQGFFFGRELAGRLTGHVHGRRGSPLYYVGVSLVGWLPWWPFAVKAARRALTQWRAGTNQTTWRDRLTATGTEGWIVLTGLAIFSLASSKLPTYTLPLLPWAALVAAKLFCARIATARTPWPPAAFFATAALVLVATIGVIVAPWYETQFGVNSSVREVCRVSQAAGPRRIYSDRYWPGLEFYLDEPRVRYLIEEDRVRERSTDLGEPAGLFISPRGDVEPTTRTNPDVWLLRFRKQEKSPFVEWEKAAVQAGTLRQTGHFILIPARLENGRLNLKPELSPR